MARGKLYHVTTDRHCINEIDASDFFGREAELGVEYFANRTPADSNGDIVSFANALQTAGFHVQLRHMSLEHTRTLDGQEEKSAAHYNIYSFDSGNEDQLKESQKKYFQETFDRLKTKIDDMTLREFATDPGVVYDIMRHVDDRYGDIVALDEGRGMSEQTMMQFIRKLTPGKTYYISAQTVLMH